MRALVVVVVASFALPALAEEVCEPGKVGAFRICQAQCNDGDQAACTTLGVMLFHGTDGASANPPRAASLWDKACKLTDVDACAWLGYARMTGRGLPKNTASAQRTLHETCSAGLPRACVWLGLLHLGTVGGVPPNPQKAKQLFEAACEGPVLDGCVPLGRMYESGAKGIVEKDPGRSMSLYMKVCQGSDVRGCPDAGRLHLHGIGTRKDPRTALGLFQKGCALKDPRSCTELGKVYRDGNEEAGVEADVDRARATFSEACSAQEQLACVQLGWLHYRGAAGIPTDQMGAMGLFTRACEAGEPEGCTAAGWALGRSSTKKELADQNLRKVRRDDTGARVFLQRGCGGAHARACELLTTFGQWNKPDPG